MYRSLFISILILLVYKAAKADPPHRLIRHEVYTNDTLSEYTQYSYNSFYGYNPTYEAVFDKSQLRESYFLHTKPKNNLYDLAVLHNVQFYNVGNKTYYINYFDHFHRPVLQIDSSTMQEISYRTIYEYNLEDKVRFYSNFSYSKWGKNGKQISYEMLNNHKMISRWNSNYVTDSEEVNLLFVIDTFYFDNDKPVKHFTNFTQEQNDDYCDYYDYDEHGLLKSYKSYRYYTANYSALDRSVNYTYTPTGLLKERISPIDWNGAPFEQSTYFYNKNYYPDSLHYKNRDEKIKFYFLYDVANNIVEKRTVYDNLSAMKYVEKYYYETYYPTSRTSADGLDDFYLIHDQESNYLNIKANLNLATDIQLYMYNMEGKVMYSMYLPTSTSLNHRIYSDGFSKGIYFVRINTQTGSRVQKVQIQ